MATLKIESLKLTDIRTPNMSEHDTGADVVTEYTCEETGGKVKIYGQKNGPHKAQWLPEEQKNYPDEPAILLMTNSSVIDTWANNSIKYAKELFM